MRNQLCIVECAGHENFGPLTHFRPVFDLRCGILTLREKLQAAYGSVDVSLHCRSYLQEQVRRRSPGVAVNEWPAGPALLLDARLLADPELPRQIPVEGPLNVVFTSEGEPVAARLSPQLLEQVREGSRETVLQDLAEQLPAEPVSVHMVHWPWDLVAQNGRAITRDFWKLVAKEVGDFHHGLVHPSAALLHPECIRIGEGSYVEPGAVLDARGGPIYIGRDALIMPGAVVEGPVAIGDGCVIKIHAKIYSCTTLGPVCKIGGEVENSIVQGYSNKQHDGFLGHSVLGEWCNLGAGTNNSDLKNNYGHVRMKIAGESVDTGQMLCGLVMGDHSKTGIGTNLNTGTVVGSCCNIFGGGLPPKEVASFSWGGADGFVPYDVEKAVSVARTVTGRRGIEFGPVEEGLMREVFELTREERVRAGIAEVTADLVHA